MCRLPARDKAHILPILPSDGVERGNSESAGNNKRMPMINIVKKVRIQSMWHRCQHQRAKKRERADERA